MPDLARIVKAYDIRGLVPEELDADLAGALGAAAVHVLGDPAEGGRADCVVVGHDMRESSVPLSEAFAAGVSAQGADVVLIGLASTDQLYFASGHLGLPGAMFTASHNPAAYNGIKLCRAGATPVAWDTGLERLRDLAAGPRLPVAAAPGTISRRDVLADYAAYLHRLVGLGEARPLTVVVDAGNGMAGHTVPAVLDGLPFAVVPLYFELDGTFPNHEANPLDPTTLVDLQATVRETGADLGLAFDGDADRCFVVDERGEPVSPSALTALIAVRELARDPGAAVIHNLITSRAVPEVVREHGGTPVRTRVGHSYIKRAMAETGAVFGGEHSGHFYFRDFWRADSGMLAALHTLAALAAEPAGTRLSQLVASYERYAGSGEVNLRVGDPRRAIEAVRAAFAVREGVRTDELDGLTVEHGGPTSTHGGPTSTHGSWWFNVRPSNTEPLLRLNVEAGDAGTMARLRDEVVAAVTAAEPGRTG
ncbi:MAG TPA: phosphomannomutase/phosphoglucomutase [Jiangellales bacterium]|nr:phosphomannomutase/phosphoglucomutase [Jiangellales bacterium]